MKYKVGDKVKYDGGDWWFFGTVSAVFDHSICPCYRLIVERMEKKSCKFSITQFEFELEPYNEKDDSGKEKREWENSEIEYFNKYYGVLNNDDLSKMLKRSPREIEERGQLIKLQKAAPEQKPKVKPEPKMKVELEPKPKVEPEPKPKVEPEQKLIVEPEPKPKVEPELKLKVEPELKLKAKTESEKTEPQKKTRIRKTSDAWDKNFDLYLKGNKSSVVSAWKSKNKKDYQTGKLSEDKLVKLKEVNFSFDADRKSKLKKEELKQAKKKETPKRKRGEAWDLNLEAYTKGEKSNIISTWIAHNRKLYKEGKLSEEKFVKLIDINFPFELVRKSQKVGKK